MEISYDKDGDTLYIYFTHKKPKKTDEIEEGIIVDYDKADEIIGIEILNFSQRSLNLNEIITKNNHEIIPMVVKC